MISGRKIEATVTTQNIKPNETKDKNRNLGVGPSVPESRRTLCAPWAGDLWFSPYAVDFVCVNLLATPWASPECLPISWIVAGHLLISHGK